MNRRDIDEADYGDWQQDQVDRGQEHLELQQWLASKQPTNTGDTQCP